MYSIYMMKVIPIKKTALFLMACLLISVSAKPVNCGTVEKQPVVDQRLLRGIHLIYDRRFIEAEALFDQITTDTPLEPAGHFYRAMITWSRLAAGFWTKDVVETFKKRIDRSIDCAEKRIDSGTATSYDFFYLGGALGFKGRFELMKANWFASFLLASDAIKALKTCHEMDPNNKDVMLGLGTFDYYTARLSGVLKFLTYFLLHRGDRKEGIKKLNEAARDGIYSSTEAKSVLLHINLFLEKNFKDALALATELSERYPENPRFKTLEGVCLIQMNKMEPYERVLGELKEKNASAGGANALGIWQKRAVYLEASDALFHGKFQNARIKLNQLLAHPDPVNDPAMIAWPILKLGVSHDLEENRKDAIKYYRQVLDMENGAGAQFLAEKFLETPVKPKDPFIGY